MNYCRQILLSTEYLLSAVVRPPTAVASERRHTARPSPCSCHTLGAPPPPPSLEQKTATAVAYCKRGRGLIKVNGCPIELLEPAILRVKTFEPVLLLGPARFSNVDIRVRVRGGGYTSQVTFNCDIDIGKEGAFVGRPLTCCINYRVLCFSVQYTPARALREEWVVACWGFFSLFCCRALHSDAQ